jgi:hypothetical protein
MRMCQPHWDLLRAAVDERGMNDLVAKDSKAATDNLVAEMEGAPTSFDPLMSLNNHFFGEALRCGGLYLMALNDKGEHYCPICEFEKHGKDFNAKAQVAASADAMLAYARDEGLLPKVQ